MTEASSNSPAQSTGGISPPENGQEETRHKFALQVEVALRYVEKNRYDYGHELSKVSLKRSVTDVEEGADGLVRVWIKYVPEKATGGSYGLEYVDVSPSGEVLVRRQSQYPKVSYTPWKLLAAAVISVISAAVLIPLFLLVLSQPDQSFRSGRFLTIRIEESPRPFQELHFTGIGGEDGSTPVNLAIRPSSPENRIFLTKLEVSNFNLSQEISIIADESAVSLVDQDGKRYAPLDPVSAAVPAELNPRYVVDGFQYIWGSLTLNQGYQVAGYFLFDVPEGTNFSRLTWRASDLVSFDLE